MLLLYIFFSIHLIYLFLFTCAFNATTSQFRPFTTSMYSAVIFDIHENFIKCGFAGNIAPTCSLVCDNSNDQVTDEKMKWSLLQQFRRIFSTKLLLTPRHERAVILESEFLDGPSKNRIAKILLHDLQLKSVAFLPRTPCILISRGIRNGLIIDMGWNHTSVTAIGELTELMPTMSTIRGISWALNGSHEDEKHEKISLETFMAEPNRSLPLDSIFFDNDKYNDDEEQSILQLVIKTFDNLDIDSRGLVSKHIIIQSHLGYEIPTDVKDKLMDLLKKKGWKSCSWTKSPGSWVGASLYLSSARWVYDDSKPVNEIRREDIDR